MTRLLCDLMDHIVLWHRDSPVAQLERLVRSFVPLLDRHAGDDHTLVEQLEPGRPEGAPRKPPGISDLGFGLVLAPAFRRPDDLRPAVLELRLFLSVLPLNPLVCPAVCHDVLEFSSRVLVTSGLGLPSELTGTVPTV